MESMDEHPADDIGPGAKFIVDFGNTIDQPAIRAIRNRVV
jgi:hypothetical protein